MICYRLCAPAGRAADDRPYGVSDKIDKKPILRAYRTQSGGPNPFASRNGSAPTGGFQYYIHKTMQ